MPFNLPRLIHLAVAGLGLLAASLPAPVAFPQQSTQAGSLALAHITKAQEALARKDFAAAKSELVLALRADPKNAQACLMLGITEFESGKTVQAIVQYRRAIQLEPTSFTAHYNLALAYLRDKNPQDALPELKRAVSLDPKQADAAYNLGVVLLDLGHPVEALEALGRAKTLNPERQDVAFNVIRADLAAARKDEARREAENARKAFGSDSGWDAAIGRLFSQNGQPREAVVYLAEALRLRPELDEIRPQLAAAYLQSQQPGAALDVLQKPATAEDHYVRASAYYLLHHLPEADQEMNQALALSPRDPRFLLLRARILQHSGRHDVALPLLEQAISLAPNWADPFYSAGVSYYSSRRYAEARRSLDRAIRLDPKSARALFLYAATLENEGKTLEGEDYLRRAIALEPANARFHYHLGSLLLRENNILEAQKAFAQALELKPDYAWAHYQLGKLFVDSNRLEAATHELELAVQYDPELARAYYQLSRVYGKLGKNEKSTQALATFNKLKKYENDEDQELATDVEKESGLR